MAKGKRGGATFGSSKPEYIASAGKQHVVLSKKLVAIVVGILVGTAVIFFSIEERKIRKNIIQSKNSLAQNNAIRTTNLLLQNSQDELGSEQDELVDMYSKWLSEDGEEMELEEHQLAALKEQFGHLKEKMDSTRSLLATKEESLQEKEDRLRSYQFKIQQKQRFLEQLSAEIESKKGKVPEAAKNIDAEWDEYEDWEWADDSLYVDGGGDGYENDSLDFDDDAYEELGGDDDWVTDDLWW